MRFRHRIVTATFLLVSLILPTGALAQVPTGVVGWGGAGMGGINIPPGTTNIAAISAKGSWLALRADGTISGIPGTTNISAIAAGYSHSLAVSNGMVVGWGDNGAGELNSPASLTNVVAVDAGVQDSLALKSDGTLQGWGYNGYGQVNIPPGLSNVVAISAGYYHCLALRSDGTVAAWGYNADSETDVPPNLGNVVAVAGGYYHSLALKQDGTVVAWGGSGSGQTTVPTGLSGIVGIAAGAQFSMALRSDGTVIAWGDNTWGQTNVPPGLSNVIAVAGAFAFSLALTNDGSPSIVQQPANHFAYPGSTARFSVVAAGPQQPFSYQWQSNSVNIAGATHATLSLTNVQPSNAGPYRVMVSNSVGSVFSLNATLSVIQPPSLVVQPQNLTTNGGAVVTLTSTIDDPGPFTYQWQFNGTNLLGATNANLTLTNVLDGQSGLYNLVASNALGVIVSSNSTLSVVPWVTPSIQPNSVVLNSGTVVTYTLSEGGFSPGAVYQWRLNGNSLGGFWAWTNSGAGIQGFPAMTDAGSYDIVVTDPYTSVTSSVAILSVMPLVITAQPQSRSAWLGGSVSFKVTASGGTPISYQWQFYGTNIPGAVTNPLVLPNVQAWQLGPYDVVVSNAYTNIPSSVATLSGSEVAVWGGTAGETNLILGLTNVIAISGGASGSYDCQALRSDRTAVVWPAPSPRPPATNQIAIAGGNPGFGLRPNGTVNRIPSDSFTIISGLSNVVAIASCSFNHLVLMSNGVSFGQPAAGGPSTSVSNAVAVAEGSAHSLVLKADGTAVAWGNNTYGQTNIPPGLSNVVAIAAGYYHNLALKTDGHIVAWGRNFEGQTNVPPGLSNVLALAAGEYHSLALKDNGTVIAWGLNAMGQTNVPAGLTNVVAIAAGQFQSMALIGDGPPQVQAQVAGGFAGPNRFAVSLPTQSGHVYVLEDKDQLSDGLWNALPLIAGNGTNQVLIDPAATASQRVYRVRRF